MGHRVVPGFHSVAVWEAFMETIGIYGVDGARQTQLSMPSGWTYQGDHDPVWMPDGTSVWIDGWALPSTAARLDGSRWETTRIPPSRPTDRSRRTPTTVR